MLLYAYIYIYFLMYGSDLKRKPPHMPMDACVMPLAPDV